MPCIPVEKEGADPPSQTSQKRREGRILPQSSNARDNDYIIKRMREVLTSLGP